MTFSYPHVLEVMYNITDRVLSLFRPWLRPGGRGERVFVMLERVLKGPLFGCRMCGQCVLHSTGMVCPMRCPKNMRNGPCGGVRPNGHCEVIPEMMCVWMQAWENARRMPIYGHELLSIQPPHNWQLHGTSSWINRLNGIDQHHPPGWDGEGDRVLAPLVAFFPTWGKEEKGRGDGPARRTHERESHGK